LQSLQSFRPFYRAIPQSQRRRVEEHSIASATLPNEALAEVGRAG